MKKNIVNFVSAVALGAMCIMAACSGEVFDETVVEEMVDGSHWQRADINLQVNRINFDAQAGATRTVDEGWKGGDRIYLILKDKNGDNVQAYVEYDATAASWGQVEYDGYKSYLTCTTPRTVEAYYFDGTVDVTASDITFDATTGVYVCTDGVYTYPSDGDLEVSISLVPLTSRIRFVGEADTDFTILNGMKTYTGFSRTTGQLTESLESINTSVDTTGTTPYIYGVFANPEEPMFEVVNNRARFNTVFDASTDVLQVGRSGYIPIPTVDSHRGWKQIFIPATSISLDRQNIVMLKGETTMLNALFTPTDATSELSWSSTEMSVVTVSETGLVTGISNGVATIIVTVYDNTSLKATCEINVINGNANGHAYVDLGLPSGTLWATMNVGATSPEDYGDYFAWGEVTGKTYFSWSNYKYCNGTYDSMTKYCTNEKNGNVDNKTELELSDDAARHNWEGSWRIPSKAQLYELYDKCIWTWITQNGINGYLVSSKKNGNSIFLPAAGLYSGEDMPHGSYAGYYWSRSLDIQHKYDRAHSMYFFEGSVYPSYNNSYDFIGRRGDCGMSVRPVLDPE